MSTNLTFRSIKALAFACCSLITTESLASNRFEFGTIGYLMDACEEAQKGMKTFETGYCLGVVDAASESLQRLGTLGVTYCPTVLPGLYAQMAIVTKWIKDHPQSWDMNDVFLISQGGLLNAYPCPQPSKATPTK